MVSMDERQRPTSSLEVQKELRKIKQHAAEATTGLDPVPASAPTQYNAPMPPAPVLNTNPAPPHAATVPVNSHPAPSPAPGQIPPLTPTAPTPQARARGTRGPSTIWTIGLPFFFLRLSAVSFR